MILKTKTTASEYNNPALKSIYAQNLARSLLDYKISGLTMGLIIPDDLIAGLESYAQRNSLTGVASESKTKKSMVGCCPRCLKAHMLKTAEKIGISQEGRKFLALFMPGEAGHYGGYYLDEDKLMKI